MACAFVNIPRTVDLQLLQSMMLRLVHIRSLAPGLCLLAVSICGCFSGPGNEKLDRQDMQQFYGYLKKGDSIYAQKNHLDNFVASMAYYDSAARIANKYDNDSLQLHVNTALAQAYEAWNLQPQKTIDYFGKASAYASKLGDRNRALYLHILQGHAYMKALDSAKAVQTCEQIDQYEMVHAKPAEMDHYYTELAYICVCRNSYPHALRYSQKIRHPQSIVNNGINYRSHYMLTQNQLHVNYLHTDIPAWMDSIKATFSQATNLSDSLYFCQILILRYTDLNQHDSIARYESIIHALEDRFSSTLEKSKARNVFLEHEVGEAEMERALADAAKQQSQRNMLAIAIIAVLLSIITIIILVNRKKISKKNRALAKLNEQLDEKSNQNLLLVKEMHHRIKNNLYLIYSLLDMQGRKTGNLETQEELQTAKQRIESIAITHEQLYNNQDGEMNMASYIANLINNIIGHHTAVKQLVPVISIDQSIKLGINTCLPLAMLINEWLTNTSKYAVSTDNTVHVHIHAVPKNGKVELTYYDTGLKDAVTERTKEGLGSKIIVLLCKQINAVLVTDHNNQPFHYKIVFAV